MTHAFPTRRSSDLRFRRRHFGHVEGYVAEPRVRRMGLGLELSGLRADGSEFPVAISLSPVETSEGTLTIAAIRAVTEPPHHDRSQARCGGQEFLLKCRSRGSRKHDTKKHTTPYTHKSRSRQITIEET